MTKPYDTRLIMMVAQERFEHDFNQFCTLLPIAYVDGHRPVPDDFPNDGEIWWMLTAQSQHLAEPGRLLVGTIEDAVRYDKSDPASSAYQVKRESIQDLAQKDGLAIIDISGDALDDLQDLVSGSFRMQLPATPPLQILLRWRSHVSGPFAASLEVGGDSGRQPSFSFAPTHATDMTVYQIEGALFEAETVGLCLAISEQVSPTTRRRSEGVQLKRVAYEILRGEGYEQMLANGPATVIIEPIDRKLVRYAKQCLTRNQRRQLRELLEELDVTGRETQDAQDMVEAITRVREVTQKQDAALEEVAKALLENGLLGEERIAEAERAFAETYVENTTAKLQAQIEESLADKRKELAAAETELKAVNTKMQNEEAQQREKMVLKLAAEKETAKHAMADERLEFERQKSELERQQHALRDNLEKVTAEFRSAGDEVINRFLTIAPLIGLQERAFSGAAPAVSKEQRSDARTREVEPFSLPAFVTASRTAAGDSVPEKTFLQRFQQVVDESGFTYRPVDLRRFHLSVKCGGITVLGGASGTGKSSLPRLYTQALLGSEANTERPGCLMVNVNPSWMDTRDLLGHMNSLEGRFFPAESGLYEYLLCAQEENRTHGTGTGLYPVCLDEMNLSQVEHYFSDFMVAIEREGDDRAIQCFSREATTSRCPFRQWGRVKLSPSTRFIGTVNFDETTRLLSDRFLDRVNLIRLGASALPSADVASDNCALPVTEGRMITLMDFQAWCHAGALPSDLGSLVDQLRPVLSQIGCPISPRVYRSMCRFVASAEGILQPGVAFDIQMAQRVVPKIRTLVAGSRLDALDELLRTLKSSSICAFDETILLLQESRASAGSRDWNFEE